MDENSPNSEDLIDEMEDQEDDGDEIFENEGLDHESDGHHGFGIEGDDHENDGEQFFIDASIHEESEQGIELEGEDHCSDGQQFLEVRDHNAENDTFQVLNLHCNGEENNLGNNTVGVDDSSSKEKYYHPPVVGMEFESYDDAYNYYNCYAKELGFAIRVKSSWTKRNSKEKRGAVLCCNCEGFKTFKEATCRRKETRTGCLAMIRLRLVESNRWRIDEVKLEHNHLFDPERVQNSKSHKKIEVGLKRDLEPTVDVEVRTIKLYRTSAIDAASSWNLTTMQTENGNHIRSCCLKLKAGDSLAIHNYFCQKQLTSPNFFYIMDLNDEGQLRNVFWIDSQARAAYIYFGDVVAVDTTCLSNKYEIPLVAFIGINHHWQSILLGCAFIAEETVETYVWLFRTWLTCMLGRSPQTIVTDRSRAIQSAISEVFPRAHHRFCLPLVMQSIFHNLGQMEEFEAFQSFLNGTVYNSLKIDEFETSWDNMIQRFGIKEHEWLQIWYDDREKWVPVYQKDIFLAGLFAVQAGESSPFFAGHIHERTSVKEFFDLYDVIIEKKRLKEALDDLESGGSNLLLRTRCYYELQLSKFYTKQIFEKFQVEVEMMSCCVTINQVHTSGPVTTYVVKECENGGIKELSNFEVMYDKAAFEVRCVCGGFYLNGYLCRHALSVLNLNGVEEIPFSYILQRWRKDCKQLYVPDLVSNAIDISNPTQWYDHLHKRAMQVVEAGMVSQDHYMVAWQAFLESLNKVRLTEEKNV
ncbi:protein FAR1-RELATED SEQUENCE 8-like [Chenopodium quinoa]|uniref:protein FAR1-RELATED SEQUENCE 8-like n=1 Tax=Chenopodium quinoa TaxID=63459 RepID=UPI000B76BAA1|nr:protein FAR1-RELATED SEQUENCE 8-like [Chenopodium quinoa]XP_021731797.1 protein FAR1-RELATED SEQUENCE 8-like [Chenopodium quinoa]XP_021731798.1 protein FAR1-RELATED SEQUENCE 8-like [Chenopodium quinoa]XP_021731799.1 protein FAR1-RELATED SEQUENCE 8-like [Chenopodium quinoa]XP_021731800.1 protein FAR1-RELATED SEQUENCE 8-like [Chenopodium quinoa]